MGLSKNPRSGKRSSNSPYLSTATMVVFVAFCLLGVWMFTSNSVIPPQTQKQQTISTSSRVDSMDLMEDTDKIPESDSRKSSSEKEDFLGRRALRPPIDEEEEEKQVEQTGEEIDNNNNDNGGDRSESSPESNNNAGAAGDTETTTAAAAATTGDGDDLKQQLEIEEDKPPKEEDHQDDEKQQPREEDEGEEHEAVPKRDEENEPDQSSDDNNGREGDKTEESVENQLLSQTEEEESQIAEVVENQQQSETDENVENRQSETGGDARVEQPKTEESLDSTTEEEGGEKKKSEMEETVKESNESFPDAGQSKIPNKETDVEQGGSWATQADQSENEKARQKENSVPGKEEEEEEEEETKTSVNDAAINGHRWELCNVTAGPNYIPCLDNEKALKQIHDYRHFAHRERHCPEEGPTCLVPLPNGYKPSIGWPKCREKIWYSNVPSTKLAVVKGHQNWVKVTGEYLTFPGGGTQFIHGALHYIDFLHKSLPRIAWGKRTRVILDVGCGVASFGGYLFERDVLAMSFAPKDEHEAQIQFALERGIPAISAVMGSKRLPFPSGAFDIVHCARCRVPWHAEGGTLLLELNRVLRPGGYFVWSATPVYQKLKEDVEIWKAMSALTISMCWDLFTIKKDRLNSVGAAIYRKPTSNECYESRKQNNPPMCEEKDDPDAAWYVPLQACMHRVPEHSVQRGSQWPKEWPVRLQTPPYWLNSSQVGVYGRPAPEDFLSDYQHWKRVLTKSYLNGLGIDWSTVRNVMDMRAVYGGFAAALRDLKVWVMNVVNVDSPDTLPIIYERGLFGIYHDWCESFSTYPRTYDLLHADTLFSKLKDRCNIVSVMAEIDRILRPGGKLIVRDESSSVSEIESLVKSLHWEVRLTYSMDNKGILCAQKTDWRPETFSAQL